jgi:hypothetical protein
MKKGIEEKERSETDRVTVNVLRPIEKPVLVGNHFSVSYNGPLFQIEVLYIDPQELHLVKTGKKDGPATARSEARIAIAYDHLKELYEAIRLMVNSFEEGKEKK